MDWFVFILVYHVNGYMKGLLMFKMLEQRWTYRGHGCHIYIEKDVGCSTEKAFHWIKKPDGEFVLAPLDSWDCSRNLVEDWIDLNYPEKIGIAPLNAEDIKLLKLTGGES